MNTLPAVTSLRSPLLTGKRALVTGASRGLGRALCEVFAAEGADVAFNFSNDQEGADETLARIERNGRKALAYKASVLDDLGIVAMMKRIEEAWGGIDILINNAGVSQPLPLALMEEADWDLVMDVNVKGQFLISRAVLKGMIRRKSGVILNISSLAGVRLIEAPIHYSASKAAIKGFTQALSKEVARYGVRVNCLAPGLLDEGVGRSLPDHRLNDYLKHVSLRRMGTVEEVAKCAAFMVSDRNSYMNGETVLIDGGL
jgi:3-oxoacyl-[acyl-carrier protein] reductase